MFEQANRSRASEGVEPLSWDRALAEAALQHCRRMAAEGDVSHRYQGEPDVSERAGQAGARFSLIEENVAVSSRADLIHQGWMDSPHHRANLLNPSVDRVGVAVVASRGYFYAVADYARDVPAMTQDEAEREVAQLVRANGVAVLPDPTAARAACATDRGMPRAASGPLPLFVMRWQGSDLTSLPHALQERLASGDYRRAAVGSCAPQGDRATFTVYRMAVLLYAAPSPNEIKPFY